MRCAVIRFDGETHATGSDARVMVDAMTGWIGTDGQPFGLLGDGGNLSGLDADPKGYASRPWPLEPYYRWAVVQPELDIEEVSAQEADAVVKELTFGRAAGRRRGPDRVRDAPG